MCRESKLWGAPEVVSDSLMDRAYRSRTGMCAVFRQLKNQARFIQRLTKNLNAKCVLSEWTSPKTRCAFLGPSVLIRGRLHIYLWLSIKFIREAVASTLASNTTVAAWNFLCFLRKSQHFIPSTLSTGRVWKTRDKVPSGWATSDIRIMDPTLLFLSIVFLLSDCQEWPKKSDMIFEVLSPNNQPLNRQSLLPGNTAYYHLSELNPSTSYEIKLSYPATVISSLKNSSLAHLLLVFSPISRC